MSDFLINLIALYIITLILGYGVLFAHFQNKFDIGGKNEYIKDMKFSFLISLFGPISFVFIMLKTNFGEHGIKFF